MVCVEKVMWTLVSIPGHTSNKVVSRVSSHKGWPDLVPVP